MLPPLSSLLHPFLLLLSSSILLPLPLLASPPPPPPPPWTSEGLTLLALKSTWLDPRRNLRSWTPSALASYCFWTGITCETFPHNSSHVVNITIPHLLRGGTLTSTIARLPQLRILDLSRNHLTGVIPAEISRLQQLLALDLSYNLLTGQLFSNWTSLQNLRSLRLHGNNLNGSIPRELGSLNFIELDLGYNQLNGQIPEHLGNLSYMRTLNLEFNQLQGHIPHQLGNLSKLERLSVRHNSLSGSIPTQLFYSTALRYLQVEDNNLTGSIPTEIGELPNLRYLAIENNLLSGSIPASLGDLTQLVALYAGHNLLSGGIPNIFANLTNLVRLELQNNRLVGPIPSTLGSLEKLKTLNLSSNDLNGTIPSSLLRFPNTSFSGNPHLCRVTDPRCSSTNRVDSFPPPAGRISHNSDNHRKKKIIIGVVVGGCGLLILLFVLLCVLRWRKKGIQIQSWFHPDAQVNRQKAKMEMFIKNFRYSYNDIVSCAGYYDTAHVLGKGRFATVYRSNLPDGSLLAVKVFSYPNLSLGFEKEVEMLGMIKHRNLLHIRGYYSNPAEKAIFYDFIPNGSLYNLLHGQDPNVASLPNWSTRQKIALGTAQALTYLHSGYNIRIIHKDVKSSNIMLDSDMAPRLSDFGLVGVVTGNQNQGMVSVIETPGYTPPELRSTKRYTEKSDVYSFGVVLLELVTGKKPVSMVGDRKVSLVNWARRLHKEGRGKEMLDPKALETCPFPDFMDRALNLGILCLNDSPSQRPTMSEVAAILESLAANSSPLRSPEMRADRPLLF